MSQKYFAIMELDAEGRASTSYYKRQFVRFEVPNAEEVRAVKNVRTYVWFHPLTMMYHVHEMASGSYLAAGPTAIMSADTAASLIVKTGEQAFFQNLAQLGHMNDKPEISFEEAMRRIRLSLAHPQHVWR